MELGDVDSDGLTDIVFTYSGKTVSLLNKGGFTFQEQELLMTPSSTRSVVLGDYDADGRLDLLVGTDDGMYWGRNLSNTSLEFELSEEISGITVGWSTANGDLNNDGAMDVVVSNGDLWWLENDLDQVLQVGDLNDESISFSPNPFMNRIVLEGSATFDMALIRNASGELVSRVPITDQSLELANLSPGVYFIELFRIQDPRSSQIIRAVKL